jgi:hypothetical protein
VKILSDTPNSKTLPLVGARRLSYASIEVAYLTVKHRSTFRKKDYPVSEIRRYLEPGPVVLVSSAWKENTNIITMGWHMVLEFSPSLVACCISNANHSFEMIRRSQECVINVPTTDLVNKVIGSGNCSDRVARHFNLLARKYFTRQSGFKCLFGSFSVKNYPKEPFRGWLRVNFCRRAAGTP